MFKIIIIALSVILMSNASNANNVIPIQEELKQDQVEWLNKHRSDKDIGNHNGFVYYREDSGYIWSISINEYKKSKYFSTSDLIGYFEVMIEDRKTKEVEVLTEVLSKSLDMLIDLIDDGMSETSAKIITQNTYPRFKIVNGTPTAISNLYPNITITPHI